MSRLLVVQAEKVSNLTKFLPNEENEMLDRAKLQEALKAVLSACMNEANTPANKYSEQLNAADRLLEKNSKLFSCYGLDCCWQRKAS